MLYGISPVEEALKARRRLLRKLYLSPDRQDRRFEGLRELAGNLPVIEADNHRLSKLSGSPNHQGAVLDCGAMPTVELKVFLKGLPEGPASLLALDQVEDPQNLGSLARSAAFLGVSGILLPRRHSAPLSASASKASAGALERMPVVEVPNLSRALAQLRDKEFWRIFGAESGEGAIDYRKEGGAERFCLVMGSEGKGLRRLTREHCDALLHIPSGGAPGDSFESLNVGVAGALLLANLLQDRGL